MEGLLFPRRWVRGDEDGGEDKLEEEFTLDQLVTEPKTIGEYLNGFRWILTKAVDDDVGPAVMASAPIEKPGCDFVQELRKEVHAGIPEAMVVMLVHAVKRVTHLALLPACSDIEELEQESPAWWVERSLLVRYMEACAGTLHLSDAVHQPPVVRSETSNPDHLNLPFIPQTRTTGEDPTPSLGLQKLTHLYRVHDRQTFGPVGQGLSRFLLPMMLPSLRCLRVVDLSSGAWAPEPDDEHEIKRYFWLHLRSFDKRDFQQWDDQDGYEAAIAKYHPPATWNTVLAPIARQSNVTKIVLRKADASMASIAKLLSLCRKLVHFEYHATEETDADRRSRRFYARYGPEFDPGQLSEALFPFRESLERLVLRHDAVTEHFKQIQEIDVDNPRFQWTYVSRNLESFTALRYLEADLWMLVRPPHARNSENDSYCLVDMLPKHSLETLVLSMVWDWPRVTVEDAMEEVIGVVEGRGRFRCLKRMELRTRARIDRELLEMLRELEVLTGQSGEGFVFRVL